MLKEGEIRIPSGCAIAGMLCRSGRRISGESIIKSIAVMHDRSNGLGEALPAMEYIPNIRIISRCMCSMIHWRRVKNANAFWTGISIL